MDLKNRRVDSKKIEGVWVEIQSKDTEELENSAQFKIRKFETQQGRNFTMNWCKKNNCTLKYLEKLNENDPKDIQLAESLNRDVLSEFIILDWKGITDNGKPVKFSVQKCKEILDEVPEFALELQSEFIGKKSNKYFRPDEEIIKKR